MKIYSAYHCFGLAFLCTANSLFGQSAPATARPEKSYKNPIGVTLGDPYVLQIPMVLIRQNTAPLEGTPLFWRGYEDEVIAEANLRPFINNG